MNSGFRNAVDRIKVAIGRHARRTRPSGLDCVIGDRVDFLNPAHWDALTGEASFLMSRDYQRLLEAHATAGMQRRYALGLPQRHANRGTRGAGSGSAPLSPIESSACSPASTLLRSACLFRGSSPRMSCPSSFQKANSLLNRPRPSWRRSCLSARTQGRNPTEAV